MPLNGSIPGAKCGAQTNANGQVCCPDGCVIAGVYAAGVGMAIRLACEPLGPARPYAQLDLGFICGEGLLKDNQFPSRKLGRGTATLRGK